jgi:hypothetical protein
MNFANASTTKIKRFLSIINPEFKFNSTTEVDEIIKEGVCTSNVLVYTVIFSARCIRWNIL